MPCMPLFWHVFVCGTVLVPCLFALKSTHLTLFQTLWCTKIASFCQHLYGIPLNFCYVSVRNQPTLVKGIFCMKSLTTLLIDCNMGTWLFHNTFLPSLWKRHYCLWNLGNVTLHAVSRAASTFTISINKNSMGVFWLLRDVTELCTVAQMLR